MMRSLWIAVSTLALANLLALGGFAMWLNSTGRLNKDRVEKVRQIFQPTVAQDAAKVAEEKAKVEADAKAALVVARDKRAPVTAEQRLAIIREYEETQRQKSERLQRETKDLLNQLDIQRADFDKAKAELLALQKAFDDKREQIARAETDTQLQKTLKVYESVKPAEAASCCGWSSITSRASPPETSAPTTSSFGWTAPSPSARTGRSPWPPAPGQWVEPSTA